MSRPEAKVVGSQQVTELIQDNRDRNGDQRQEHCPECDDRASNRPDTRGAVLADATKTVFRADKPRRTEEPQKRRDQKNQRPERQLPPSRPGQGRFLTGRKEVVQQSENLIMAHRVEMILAEQVENAKQSSTALPRRCIRTTLNHTACPWLDIRHLCLSNIAMGGVDGVSVSAGSLRASTS